MSLVERGNLLVGIVATLFTLFSLDPTKKEIVLGYYKPLLYLLAVALVLYLTLTNITVLLVSYYTPLYKEIGLSIKLEEPLNTILYTPSGETLKWARRIYIGQYIAFSAVLFAFVALIIVFFGEPNLISYLSQHFPEYANTISSHHKLIIYLTATPYGLISMYLSYKLVEKLRTQFDAYATPSHLKITNTVQDIPLTLYFKNMGRHDIMVYLEIEFPEDVVVYVESVDTEPIENSYTSEFTVPSKTRRRNVVERRFYLRYLGEEYREDAILIKIWARTKEFILEGYNPAIIVIPVLLFNEMFRETQDEIFQIYENTGL